MGKNKRYIKNIFQIAGVEWTDGSGESTLQDGLVITQSRIHTDTDRRIIADRQYIVSLKNFTENVIIPILLPILDPLYFSDVPDGERTDKDVGNIPAGTPIEDLKNQPIGDILDDIFFTDYPFVLSDDQQFMTKAGPADIIEVGTTIQFDVTAANFKGVIRSADLSPDIELVGEAIKYTFTDFTGTITEYNPPITNAQNHLGDFFSAVPGPMEITALIEWENGDGVYYDEKGRPSSAFDSQRLAGSSLVTQSISGRYNAFYGMGLVGSAPLLPIDIRALTPAVLNEDGTAEFEIFIPAGTLEIYFYIPDTQTATVFHEIETNTFVTSAFVVAPVAMEDAGAIPIGYSMWVLDIGGIGYLDDALFTVNII